MDVKTVLSRYQNKGARNHGTSFTQAAAVAANHTLIASPRNLRNVFREMR